MTFEIIKLGYYLNSNNIGHLQFSSAQEVLPMKKRGRFFAAICAYITSLVLLAGMFPHTALADSYTAATMRLLHYEGSVEIEDASGNPRAVMENARFNSGEAMKTAAASSASVGLDEGRIVTLDEKSRVEFEKKDGSVSMNLTEGKLFLDVSKKLSGNETMDIKTSTMVVGIRGTIVYVSSEPVTDENALNMESVDLKGLSPEKGSIVSISQIGVLEGTAQITYLDNSNREQSVSVDAGQKATVPEYSEDAEGIPELSVSDLTKDDIEGFVLNQVTSDKAIINRVKEACDVVDDIDLSGLSGTYTADGDWTWDSPVTLVAQSASKYYDGQPLTRTSDILVNNLPSIFSVKASAGGSRTDAGESENPVANYTIYNKAGEDVTRHFTNVKTVSGTLLVVPAPLTIHTGTAGKVYDGTPLTEPDAYITFYKGSGGREVPWRNTSYVVTESAGSVSYDNQTLYGICGVIWVNAANPLTGERREIQLKAGQKLSVFLSDLEGKQSIELKIENLTENDLPDELLRLYGDNPALLQQACKDTGWDATLLGTRIEALPKTHSGSATIEQGGLVIRESESDRLMQNLTNVRITVDTEITDYNNRALGSEEAHYTSLAVDESIKVKATGSQTDVGTSINTYTIDWGSANRSNYEVGEDLGTLTVTPASATITTGSAEKEYDGSPLTNSEASISGLVGGETATVTADGSITEIGSTENTYSISWNSAKSSNYSVSEDLGTLRVTAQKNSVTLTAASAEKTYDGTSLTDSTVTAQGLPSGFTVSATVSGSQTDAGSSANTIDSYTIYDADGRDVTGQFSNVTTESGTLTVNPLPVEFDLGFHGEEEESDVSEEGEKAPAVFEYAGLPYFPEWILASYEGTDEPVEPVDWEFDEEVTGSYSFTYVLPGDAKLQLNGMGYTDAGSYTIEPESSFLEGKKDNYEITFTNNSIEIMPAALTITASASKEYDGEPLSGSDAVIIEGLVEGDSITVTATGTITDAGTVDNPYTIDWGETNPDNYSVTQEPGTLEITPREVTITTGSDEKVYDGETLFYDSYELSPSDPWVSGQAPIITVTGSITNAGETPNSCNIEWKGVNPNNYNLTEELGTLTVNPVEIVLISDCAYEYSGDITILGYGLKVQIGNIDPVRYYVAEMDENAWQISFDWGDKIDASTFLIKDERSFAITPIHDFVSGDSGNYKFDTVDQAGEFDIPPVFPDDDTGMGISSAFTGIAGQASADLIREDNRKEETTQEEMPEEKPQEEAAEKEPQEEAQEEEPQEEAAEEEPQEEAAEEEPQEEIPEEEEEVPAPEEPQEALPSPAENPEETP